MQEINLTLKSKKPDGNHEIKGVSALFLGSIGTIAETSVLQLEAFNRAFVNFNIGWRWSKEEYTQMLKQAGGRRRIKDYAAKKNLVLSEAEIIEIHQCKTDIFSELLVTREIKAREGVPEIIKNCAEKNIKLGWVTTTSDQNVKAIQDATSNQIDFSLFSTIITEDDVKNPKPAPDSYLKALQKLGIDAGEAVAVEDSNSGVSSAKSASVICIAVPGEYGYLQDFTYADISLSDLHCLTLSH